VVVQTGIFPHKELFCNSLRKEWVI
jgi:hypothetical protein